MSNLVIDCLMFQFKSLRCMTYKITRRNFIESLLDIELKEPIVFSYFYDDGKLLTVFQA
jgi:hypothetical protein